MLNALKAWRLGAHRITENQIKRLAKIKPKGWLVEIIPSLEDKSSFKSLPKFSNPFAWLQKACLL